MMYVCVHGKGLRYVETVGELLLIDAERTRYFFFQPTKQQKKKKKSKFLI